MASASSPSTFVITNAVFKPAGEVPGKAGWESSRTWISSSATAAEHLTISYRVIVRDQPVRIDLPATPVRIACDVSHGSGHVSLQRWDDHTRIASLVLWARSSTSWEGPEEGILDPMSEYSLLFSGAGSAEILNLTIQVEMRGPVDFAAIREPHT